MLFPSLLRFRNLTLSLMSLSLVCLSVQTASAKDDQVQKAIDHGLKYVQSKQDQQDAFFKGKWFHAYPAGETALALLTLLKGGVDPKDRSIRAGFSAMKKAPLKKVYSVSIGILAIEARYSPSAEEMALSPHPTKTVARKKFKKKASPADRRWLQQATKFLIRHQKSNGLWNYPHGGDDDVSNTQFALLALKSAKRLGLSVPDSVWAKSLKYLLEKQESHGQSVSSFRIPAAEGSIKKLKKTKKSKESETVERGQLESRGWGYKPGQGSRASMTAAGVACLVVIKSELEHNKGYQKKLGPRVDKAIRDGCAWLALKFQADKHPGADLDWLFYYLYTLERAGTLSGCSRFGQHDWHSLGTQAILKFQQPDGRFDNSTKGESDGALAGTCLAILFLKRSTVPVLERVATGSVKSSTALGVQATKRTDGQFDVTFRLKPHRACTKVTLAGTFNSWNKDQSPLKKAKADGVYEITVVLNAGKHCYKFVLDGHEWIIDPKNPQRQRDDQGNENSMVELK